MICLGAAVTTSEYSFTLCPLEEGLVLTISRGGFATVFLKENQEGAAFSEAVREAFTDVSNQQSEFRKGLRNVFLEYYEKHPESVQATRAFYLRIIRQYSLDQLGNPDLLPEVRRLYLATLTEEVNEDEFREVEGA